MVRNLIRSSDGEVITRSFYPGQNGGEGNGKYRQQQPPVRSPSVVKPSELQSMIKVAPYTNVRFFGESTRFVGHQCREHSATLSRITTTLLHLCCSRSSNLFSLALLLSHATFMGLHEAGIRDLPDKTSWQSSMAQILSECMCGIAI